MHVARVCSIALVCLLSAHAQAFDVEDGSESSGGKAVVQRRLPSTTLLQGQTRKLTFSDMPVVAGVSRQVPLENRELTTLPDLLPVIQPPSYLPPRQTMHADRAVARASRPKIAFVAKNPRAAELPEIVPTRVQPAPALPLPAVDSAPLIREARSLTPQKIHADAAQDLVVSNQPSAPLAPPEPLGEVAAAEAPAPLVPAAVQPVMVPKSDSSVTRALVPSQPVPAPAVEPTQVSPATQRIISAIPSKIDSEKTSKSAKSGKNRDKLAVARMTPELKSLQRNAAKDEAYNAAGLSIRVARSGLDSNFELNRAYTMLMGGETSQAIEVYKNVVSAEPDNQDALFGLASTYHRIGQIESARPYYGQLLKVNPNHREGLNNFLALLSEESPEGALAELERLEQRNPDFATIPAQQAIVLKKLGYMDRAREKMARAIELAPDNLTYRYNMAIMLDSTGNYPEAAALYRMLIDAALKGEKIPAPLETLQKRLNFIAVQGQAISQN